MSGVQLIPTVFLPLTQQEAEEQAQKNLSIINAKGMLQQAVEEFVEVAGRQLAPKARLNKMYKAANKVVAAVTPESACSNGCSYCCHIPVAITQLEAEVLSKHSGRTMSKVGPGLISQDYQKYHRQPCPFLEKGKCSVYDSRPMACRLVFNLSSSPYFCNTDIPPEQSHVAYLNLNQLNYAYAGSFYQSPLADIRDFFPATK